MKNFSQKYNDLINEAANALFKKTIKVDEDLKTIDDIIYEQAVEYLESPEVGNTININTIATYIVTDLMNIDFGEYREFEREIESKLVSWVHEELKDEIENLSK